MLGKIKAYLKKNTRYGKTRYLHFLYRYDENRFFDYSSMDSFDDSAIATKMRLLIHSIEKGLSMSQKKGDFGEEKITELIALAKNYRENSEQCDSEVVDLAYKLVQEYAKYRCEVGEDVSFIPEDYLNRCVNVSAGATQFNRRNDLDFFPLVAKNRHSIREFGDDLITKESLCDAVKLAQTAPSACNRQSSHAYVCFDPEKINMIMNRHGGMKGSRNVAAIIAITGDLALYTSEYERNTVFVDGGIFLMNLLYSLDSVNIASCPIIWGAEPDNDSFIADLLGIPVSHEVISLVMVGSFPQGSVMIPCSKRRATEDVLHYV